MLNVRLDDETETQLNSMSQKSGISKSALVKEALKMYLEKENANKSAYELGKDLFGVAEDGDTEASHIFKEKISEKLEGKYSH